MPEQRSGGAAVDPPGLDLTRFETFFESARPGAVTGPLRAEVIAGGKSNLTYEVTDGQHRWIVRRPPLGHVLATAHDMAREYRVMTALQPTFARAPPMETLFATRFSLPWPSSRRKSSPARGSGSPLCPQLHRSWPGRSTRLRSACRGSHRSKSKGS